MGIGIGLARQRYRAGALTRKLSRLLNSDAVKANCREVAARFDNQESGQGVRRSIEAKLDQ